MASGSISLVGFIIAQCSFAVMSLSAICIGSYLSVKYIKSLKEKGEPPKMAPLNKKKTLKLLFKMVLMLGLLYLSIKANKMENQENNSNANFIEVFLIGTCIPSFSELTRPLISSLISPIYRDIPYHLFFKKGEGFEEKYLINRHFTSYDVISFICSFQLALWFVLTKNWIINNIFAVVVSIVFIKHFHLNKMITGCFLLTMLLIYDVFFVFGTDLMVIVASTLDTPGKLIFSGDIVSRGIDDGRFWVCGVGDIVFPGAMIAYLLRFDLSLERDSWFYFFTSIMCYSFGFLVTTTVLYITQSAQPALLYLVPCSVIPPLVAAFFRGDGNKLFSFEDHPEVKEVNKDKEEEKDADSSYSLPSPKETINGKKDD